jgi:hypothetical protein
LALHLLATLAVLTRERSFGGDAVGVRQSARAAEMERRLGTLRDQLASKQKQKDKLLGAWFAAAPALPLPSARKEAEHEAAW